MGCRSTNYQQDDWQRHLHWSSYHSYVYGKEEYGRWNVGRRLRIYLDQVFKPCLCSTAEYTAVDGLVSMTLYLEFSRKLPYTGGELAYVRYPY